MTLDFHPAAEEEFEEAALWYGDRGFTLGDRFVEAIHAATEEILSDPSRYQSLDRDIRVYRLKRFPYRIYYTYLPLLQLVRIYAVMHEKRRPDYWRKRLPNS